MIAAFEWTQKKESAALSLARGETQKAAAATAGVAERTLRYWMNEPEFTEEVDRLTLMVDIASRAHRLRIANRVIRQFVRDNEPIPAPASRRRQSPFPSGNRPAMNAAVRSGVKNCPS